MRKVMSNSLEKGVRKNTTPIFLFYRKKSSRVSSQWEIECDAPSSIYSFVKDKDEELFSSKRYLCTQVEQSLLITARNLAVETYLGNVWSCPQSIVVICKWCAIWVQKYCKRTTVFLKLKLSKWIECLLH